MDTDRNYEKCLIKVSFTVGNLQSVCFSTHNMEDAIRMAVNIQLSYLGDKSQFKFMYRTRTINF